MIVVLANAEGGVLAHNSYPGGSNNLASLLAVLLGLEWANENGHHAVTIRTQCRTIAAWIFGRIGSGLTDRQSVLHARQSITALRRKIHFEVNDLIWVPRDQNLAANVIEALDESCGTAIVPITGSGLLNTKNKGPRQGPWAKTMVI